MKFIKYLIVGTLFGIVMSKSEAISWYRIQEMFRFQSFHMYGIIGVAVFSSAIIVALIKKFNVHDMAGNPILFFPKNKSTVRYLLGGILFGLGWALSGTCPGPMVVNIGYGFMSFGVIFIFALFGTFLYGVVKDKLPH
ncbi:DUF6691 family protein [Brumimicrobium mesophilum]|uniref:DUF6691 family protein n=1 Tax=Brumimicrobium mesophilum TaxID=392717 RepID=UPI000D144361|nr:DUF6691 family protein [Brumimicrobium mesophilum]